MKWLQIRKRFISRNTFRVSKGLGLAVPLLLVAAPAALATLDMRPAPDSELGVSSDSSDVAANDTSSVEKSLATYSRWEVVGTHTPAPDSTLLNVAHRPENFRQLPFRRVQGANLPSGSTINDTPAVPEPSTVIAASLLLLPFGAGAIRFVRKSQNAWRKK